MISRKSKARSFKVSIVKGPAGSILSNMFRTIMFRLGMDENRYDALMTRYIQKANLNTSRKDKAEARAGLSEELLKESMTWKTFLKGLKFLGVTKFSIIVTTWRHGEECNLHQRTYNLDTIEVEDGADDDDDDKSTKGIPTAGSILSDFYGGIRDDLKITQDDIAELMHAYIRRSHVGISKKSEAGVRASLTKELFKPTMTWKSFIKGLNFLGVLRFKFEVKLHHAFGKVSDHGIKDVVLDEIDSE